MRPLESVRLAWRSIRGHALRSTLTTLGVVIGIAAVITFVTLGASLQAGVIGDISPDDRRNVYGWAAPPDAEGGPMAGAERVTTPRDVDRLGELDGIDAAYGYTPIPTQAIGNGNESTPQSDGLIATGPSYIREERIDEGRQFETGRREAVINPAAAALFSENVSVGDSLTVTLFGGQQTSLTVVGITDTSEGFGPFEGFGSSPRIYVPTDPFYTEIASGEGEEPRFVAIVVEAESSDDEATDRARDSARTYLESDESDASDLTGDSLEFTFQTSTELLEQLQDILALFQRFIVGIAAISLLVGSIGIANIMLVSVTERTREIGIMKAVGAQNRDVLGLFLTEAIVLGLIGAVLGTALGLAAGYLLAWYVDLPLVYPYEYVALAVVAGVLVGVLSGLYPAWRAARTDPIDALRYE